MAAPMRCHYEVLAVEQTADDATLKKAYRKMALRYHPDKNPDNHEEATRQFQLVQAAYAVLSDPQERAWYDNHRDALLRGGDGMDGGEGVDLMQFFSPAAYSTMDDGPQGFFTVYNDVFATIYKDECGVLEDPKSIAPPFGKSTADLEDVKAFYQYWQAFVTRHHFFSSDQWDVREAPNRRVKRAMEKENKKSRSTARKEYNTTVLQLVAFVKKRDPRAERVAQMQQKAKEEAEKLRQEKMKERSRRIAEEHQAQLERVQAQSEAMMESMADQLEALDSYFDQEYGDVNEVDEDSLFCIACNKKFKSTKQQESHNRSKKHKQAVSKLKKEMEQEDEDLQLDDSTIMADANPSGTSLEFDMMDGPGSVMIDDGEADEDDKSGSVQSESGSDSDDDNDEEVQRLLERDFAHMKVSSTKATSATSADVTPTETKGPEDKSQQDEQEQQEDEGDDDDSDGEEEENGEKGSSEDSDDQEQTQPAEQDQQLEQAVEQSAEQVGKQSGRKGKQSNAKPRRRRRKIIQAVLAATEFLCFSCGEQFETRNKMFQHIKKTGHALHPSAAKAGSIAQRPRKKKEVPSTPEPGGAAMTTPSDKDVTNVKGLASTLSSSSNVDPSTGTDKRSGEGTAQSVSESVVESDTQEATTSDAQGKPPKTKGKGKKGKAKQSKPSVPGGVDLAKELEEDGDDIWDTSSKKKGKKGKRR
eukprot:m.76635 g.76635  ORF g.76635 m.76635 type:complete len:699 (+) comp12494_c0_seq1:112-2208(+)